MGRRLEFVVIALAIAVGCGSPNSVAIDANPGPVIDAATPTGNVGDACSRHTDCLGGYCVEPVGGTGGVCTRTCDPEACPTGWDCRTVKLPLVEVKLCVPNAPQLCLACVNDEECGGAACLNIDGGGRCATACSGQCPTGYTCSVDPGGTHAGMFCQPTSGSCTCTAEMAGGTRSCSRSSSQGTCFGTQLCTPATGWSSCTATTPAAETCDGTDNDCNFVIDDGVGGGNACVNTNGFGSCPGLTQCDGNAGFICNGPMPKAETCNFADDNCNGTVDEGYAGLGGLCTAGTGACQRYGSIKCNALGNGTDCSAVPGTASAELCNQIDDNCNGSTDETFKTGTTALGQACAAGLGVCTRYGTYVCMTDGSATQCSATPNSGAATTESCNYLDDNCDGVLDNGFRNVGTGFYDTHTNCGACGNNCQTLFTAQNSFGECAVITSPQCVMRCNTGTGNLNGSTLDGCEFMLDAAAIYVSTTDTTALDDTTCGLGPTGTGAGNYPCLTIGQGLARAVTTGRTKVLVADGTYDESVLLRNGKDLLGGYRADTWERHLTTTSTVISGSSAAGAHDRTVIAAAITTATVFEGFVVRGSFNTKPGGNSYAIYVGSSNANLIIRNNQIFAGRGGSGAAGQPGTNGTTGANGAAYVASTYDSFRTAGSGAGCTTGNRPAYGGGVRSCGSDDVGGGNGGGNNCTPSRSTLNSTALSVAAAGQPGAGAGGGTSGAPGARGYDALHQQNICYQPIQGSNVLPMFGSDGQPGGSGAVGPASGGCSGGAGTVNGSDWAGGTGVAGVVGSGGGGGGGGGAGGGAQCSNCVRQGNSWVAARDMLGGHGGGAGTGGCGGAGGGPGGAGGGAFGIFIVGTAAPTITDNTVTQGTAGSGGTGGIGGAGGLGGTGSQGGQIGSVSGDLLFCTGKGGRGGDGGDGGAGSGGGGGCGGSSFGIYSSGIGLPNYCGSNTVSGGSAGAGGSGGYSGGNSGGSGGTGVVQTCVAI